MTMRIAYISHFYPPTQNAGIEQNTHGLATGMQAAGHTVKVLCAANWTEGDTYWQGYTEDEWDGVPVRRFNLNWSKADDPTRNLYDNEFLAEHIREFLVTFQPDIVHIASMYTLSMRVVVVAKELGIPTVMTLSDFWLICPRHTLVRYDGEICDGQVPVATCHNCMLSESRLYRVSQQIMPSDWVSSVYDNLISQPRLSKHVPGMTRWGMDVQARRDIIRKFAPYIDQFIAPSRYIAETIQRAGLEDIEVAISHHGNRLNWLSDYQPRPPDNELHFGYIGQINPIKGVHLLIQGFAANQFPPDVKLFIYGNLEANPAYTAQLQALAENHANISLEGPFVRTELPGVLQNIDVLVVPSTWPEVAGLVVQEAFAANIPVLASNMGGLPEFVQPGEGGILFDVEDHSGVQQALADVVAGGPKYLAALQAAVPPVRTIADEQIYLESVYQRLLQDAIVQP